MKMETVTVMATTTMMVMLPNQQHCCLGHLAVLVLLGSGIIANEAQKSEETLNDTSLMKKLCIA